jgi:hypothetical protein
MRWSIKNRRYAHAELGSIADAFRDHARRRLESAIRRGGERRRRFRNEKRLCNSPPRLVWRRPSHADQCGQQNCNQSKTSHDVASHLSCYKRYRICDRPRVRDMKVEPFYRRRRESIVPRLPRSVCYGLLVIAALGGSLRSDLTVRPELLRCSTFMSRTRHVAHPRGTSIS